VTSFKLLLLYSQYRPDRKLDGLKVVYVYLDKTGN
jgi:hypothetical protein